MDLSEDLRAKLPAHLSSLAIELAATISSQGGKLLIVGGSVRDLLIGENPEELDLEVRGLSTGQITSLLPPGFRAEEVGKSFGVLKIKGLPVEISLPRTERKTGTGHKGFTVEIDPNLPFELASERRDFTVNALGLDPLEGKLLDPHNGQKDLEARILRHVGPAFAEDPLRVLRAMQFIARFDLTPAKETTALCRRIPIEGFHPNASTRNGKNLSSRDGSPQRDSISSSHQTGLGISPNSKPWSVANRRPEWHPEGGVWTHTLHCMDAFAQNRTGEDWEDLVVGFAVLCHDLGKPSTTRNRGWKDPIAEA